MARRVPPGALVSGHDLGGGDRMPIRFVTDGQIVFEIVNGEPVVWYSVAEVDPDARPGMAGYFFRDSEVGMQFCVRFPSGAVQILATEP